MIDLTTKLSELTFSRAYRNFFEKKGFEKVSDILSIPPKGMVEFNFKIKNLDSYYYDHIGLVVFITSISSETTKNFMFLKGKDADGNNVKILTFDKRKWSGILNSLLKKQTKVKMLVWGILKPTRFDEEKQEYFIDARLLDLYSESKTKINLYYSNLTDNEKMISVSKTLINKLRDNDEFSKTELMNMIIGIHLAKSSEEFQSTINNYLQLALLSFFKKRDDTFEQLLNSDKDLEVHSFEYRKNEALAFDLNSSQIKAISTIISLFKKPNPSMLYVLGDVASGKSIIAYEAMKCAVNHGVKRVILMAPTVILASQHYNQFIELYPHFAYRTKMITGDTKTKQEDVDDSINVLIGTHALLSFKDLSCDMVFIDEPQKFGIEQQKFNSGNTRYVMLTATPLPMWTSLLLSSKVKSVMIDARKRNITKVPLEYTEEKLVHLLNILPNDKQTLIVAPRIANEIGNYPSLKRIEELLKTANREFVSIHGKMKSSEILNNIENFRNEKVMTLLATSMVESGLNIPSLKYLVVVGAETYGFLNLYQLSGRAGRGKNDQSFIYLLSHNTDFIRKFTEVENGYDAAKLDLKNRGSGKMDDEQSGMIKIPFGDKIDSVILEQAKNRYEIDKSDKNLENVRQFFVNFI